MLYNLSSIALSTNKNINLPKHFKDSLDVFKVDSYTGSIKFVLKSEKSIPQCNRCVFSSNLIETYTTDDNAKLIRFSNGKAKCALRYFINDGLMIFSPYPNYSLDDEEMSEQLQIIFRLAFEEMVAFYNRVSLHSSVFVQGESAICVTGPSGAGKSTLTKNWLSTFPNSYILNGDRPMLQISDNGIIAHGVPWSGKENIFVNKSAKIKAIIEVRQHKSNYAFRLSRKNAYILLLKRISKPLSNKLATLNILSDIEKIANTVPVYRLYCVNDKSAAEYLNDVLSSNIDVKIIEKDDKILKINNGYVLRKILDDNIVVPIGADSASAEGAILLDEVGTFIWKKLQQPMTYNELLNSILDEYDVEKEMAINDLNSFIKKLKEFKVLNEE